MIAEIVFAAGAPHAPGLVGLLDAAPEGVRDTVSEMYAGLQRELTAARPDVLVVFANDHLANSRIRSYPDFLLGTASEHSGPYEWFKEWIGCRDYTVRGEPTVAEALWRGLSRRGYRLSAERGNLRFDDNISVPTVMLDLDRHAIPLVPVLQNCTVPPFPDQRQCYAIGRSLGDLIAHDLPDGMRVALFGSGGLSHEPGGSRYYFIDREFDLWFLDLMASGDHRRMLDELTVERLERSGTGGTAELLTWIVVAGAVGPRRGRKSAYALHTDCKCGISSVTWDLGAVAQPPVPEEALAPHSFTSEFQRSFDPTLAGHDLVQDLNWDPALRARFATREAVVLDRYALRPEERSAIERRDFRALYAMGFHPYLGGQLARFIYGNSAGKGAAVAVRKLVESLRGEQAEAYECEQGVTHA